jgi:hypothetical protein
MYRTMIMLLALGTMVLLTDTTASAARQRRLADGKNAAAHLQGRGVLHIHVRTAGGKGASRALVRIRAGRRHMVRRANRAGEVTVAVRGVRSVIVHARGVRGDRGSSSAAMGRGGRVNIMVQLHGGRGAGAGVTTAVGRHHHHFHQSHSLGVHHSVSRTHTGTGGDVPAPSVKPENRVQ